MSVVHEITAPPEVIDDAPTLEINGGTSAATAKVTAIDTGEFCAPAALTVTCPLYVPAVSVPVVTETCSVCGAVPALGVTESHAESLLAVNVRLPVPVFVTLSEDGPEVVLFPWVPLKDNAVGMADNWGAAALMAKLTEFDVTPPGACTVTEADPALAIKLAGTAAVSCVAEPKVVVSAEPFHSTVSPEAKLAPLTVRVKPEPPAVALAGERELTVGGGGGVGGATVSVTVKIPGEPCAAPAAIVM